VAPPGRTATSAGKRTPAYAGKRTAASAGKRTPGAASGKSSGAAGKRTPASAGKRTPASAGKRTPGAASGKSSGAAGKRTAPAAGRRVAAGPGKRGNAGPGKRGNAGPGGRRTAAPPAAAAEPMRLNKYIANSGLCARREADELIKSGHVTVNGVKVTDMGVKVKLSDNVEYKGKKITPEKKVYILLNKPKGYVTTVKDPHATDTVLDLVRDATGERIYPVGRLDKSTTGVLLLTNDGDLAGRLTHPKYQVRKVYHVFADKEITRHDMEKIVEGVELEDGTISADAISYPDSDDYTQVGLEIHSGQNRVVRRIFEKLGYSVRKLDRVSFAGLTKKNLQRGTWRFLTAKEVSMLKRGIYK
jgi:pseudouridine synthase